MVSWNLEVIQGSTDQRRPACRGELIQQKMAKAPCYTYDTSRSCTKFRWGGTRLKVISSTSSKGNITLAMAMRRIEFAVNQLWGDCSPLTWTFRTSERTHQFACYLQSSETVENLLFRCLDRQVERQSDFGGHRASVVDLAPNCQKMY